MPDTAATAPLPEAVRRQAAEWLLELQSEEVTEATRARWLQWRAAHADHERAWRRMEAFGGVLKELPASVSRGTLEAAARRRPGRRQVLGGAALAFVAVGAAWRMQPASKWRAWAADHRTATGHRQDITLPDGTRVLLDGATAIDIRFSPEERVVHLITGQILVTTAADPLVPGRAPRPFFVATGPGRLRALGTTFTVRAIGDDTAHVAGLEGAVEIRCADRFEGPQTLPAGRQARFGRDRIEPSAAVDDLALAWRDGMIVAVDMRLDDFLAALSRHREGRLVCDPAVASLRVSGTYPLRDTDQVLSMLEAKLPVRIRRITRYWVTVQSADGRAGLSTEK